MNAHAQETIERWNEAGRLQERAERELRLLVRKLDKPRAAAPNEDSWQRSQRRLDLCRSFGLAK